MDPSMNEEKKIVSLKLNLCREDLQDVTKKCYRHGITLEELLENFIRDLNGGRTRNGSDESDRAQAYFDRCFFGMFPEITFVPYMLEYLGSSEGFIEEVESMEELEADLKDAEPETPEEFEELRSMKEDYENMKNSVRWYYEEYAKFKAKRNEEAESMDEAITAMKEYSRKMREVLAE